MPIPLELRERIVEALESKKLTWSETADLFGVSQSSIHRLMLKQRAGESLAPRQSPGAVSKLGAAELSWLRDELESNPYVTSYELSAMYNRRFRGNRVHRSTILRTMHALGYSHKKKRQ